VSRDPEVVLREALDEVRWYLEDVKPPALVLDSVQLLSSRPPEILAAELRSWALGQQRRSGSASLADVIFRAFKRLQVFEELGIQQSDKFRRYLDRLSALLLGALDGPERERLATHLAQLGDVEAPDDSVLPATYPPPAVPPGGPPAASRPGGSAGAASQGAGGRGTGAPERGGAEHRSEASREALHRMVAQEPDRARANARWEQMLWEAVGHFNEGSIARAVTVLELAARMLEEGEVDPETAAAVVAVAHERLSRDRLMEAALDLTRRPLLRKVLDRFPGLSAHRLIDQLSIEPDRQARRLLLALLEAGGAKSRQTILERLEVTHGGPIRHDAWHLQRNLIYVLNRIPPPADFDPAWELRVVSVLTNVRLPVQLVREAVQFVGGLPLEAAGSHLVQRMREVEKILVDGKEDVHPVPQLWRLANAIASALARAGTSEARAALVEHALSFHPRLGDTASRLADLAGADLRGQPEVCAALLDSLAVLAPMRVLGVMSTRNERALVAIVRALAATRTPEVRRALEDIAKRYEDREFGKLARQATRFEIELAPTPGTGRGALEESALSGDLRVFGLPNLLQSLQQSQATGQLNLRGENGNVFAVFRLAAGRLAACVAGGLRGETAFYQAFQQPAAGTFEFVRDQEVAPLPEGTQDLTLLLLEAVRRDDNLRRDRLVVPDEAFLRATGQRPTTPPGESDGELVRLIWTRVREGTTVIECELAARRDYYTVRRLLAHWVREGAAQVAGSRDPGGRSSLPP